MPSSLVFHHDKTGLRAKRRAKRRKGTPLSFALTIFLALGPIFSFAPMPAKAGTGNHKTESISETKASKRIEGPVKAEILRIIDGDTLIARAFVWPGQAIETHIRLRGINAPELRGKCTAERTRAAIARERLASLVENKAIALRDIGFDKYGGRMVASVILEDGTPIADQLMAEQLAIRYGAPKHWC